MEDPVEMDDADRLVLQVQTSSSSEGTSLVPAPGVTTLTTEEEDLFVADMPRIWDHIMKMISPQKRIRASTGELEEVVTEALDIGSESSELLGIGSESSESPSEDDLLRTSDSSAWQLSDSDSDEECFDDQMNEGLAATTSIAGRDVGTNDLATPERYRNEFFEVRKSALGGNGAFALKNLKRGEVILVEHPTIKATPETLLHEIDKLPPEVQAAINRMHGHKRCSDQDHRQAIFMTNR